MPIKPKKKSRKKPVTPRSQIKSALRRLWLRSRERQEALRLDKYTCRGCGAKQSRAAGREIYIEVHHQNMVENWDKLIDMVYQSLLCHPDNLITLCQKCHEKSHEFINGNKT